MSLFPTPVLVIDTETSGFAHARDHLLEIAGVLLDVEGNEVDTFGSLINPGHLPAHADRALECNKITRAMLAQAPPLKQVRQSWLEWCYRHATGGYKFRATAYNVAFDRAWTEKVSGFPPLIWRECVMKQTTAILGSRSKLSVAVERFHVKVTPTHRALDDARAAAGVLKAVQQEHLRREKYSQTG